MVSISLCVHACAQHSASCFSEILSNKPCAEWPQWPPCPLVVATGCHLRCRSTPAWGGSDAMMTSRTSTGGSSASGRATVSLDELSAADLHSAVGPWEQCLSIHERFPNAEGATLMSVFRKFYETAKDVTLAWFLDDRTPALHRHALNNRHQMDTRRKYTNMILQFGILTECRSEIVAVPGPFACK